MRLSSALASVLWSMALAACGRLAFDERSVLLPAELVLRAECGIAMPPSVDLPIDNIGATDLVIASATASGGFTIAGALPLTIAPGAQATLSIVPPAAVIGTDRDGMAKLGELELMTNEGILTVALRAVVVGANIEWTDAGGATLTEAMFVSTTGACPDPAPLKLANSGSLPAMVAYSDSSGVGLLGFTNGILDGRAAEAIEVRPITALACMSSGYASYSVTGPSCTTTPVVLLTSLNVTGSSTCMCS